MLTVGVIFSILILCKYFDMWAKYLKTLKTLCTAMLLLERTVPLYNRTSVTLLDSLVMALLTPVCSFYLKFTIATYFS